MINPYWIEDKDLKKGEVDYISSAEAQFWKDLLEKYLHPIDENKEEKARIASDLIELRNKSVFAFFMFNALFVLIVFLLQLNKDMLHVDWPLGVKTNITYIEETSEVLISKEYLQLEPIGLVFVFFFALILVIQFTAMLFHRFGTLSHILASTELNLYCGKKVEDTSQDALIDKNFVQIVKNLQRLRGIDSDKDNDIGLERVDRRRTIQHLEKNRQKKRPIGTLDVAFKHRFFNMMAQGEGPGTPVLGRKLTLRKETIKALEVRRNSVMAERRKSQMKTLGASNMPAVLPPNNNVVVPPRSKRSSTAGLFDRQNGGHVNHSFESDEDVSGTVSSIRLQNMTRNNVSWQDPEASRRNSVNHRL